MADDGSLYYLARGSGGANGTVVRIAYTVQAPRVDVTANGSDGPLSITSGSSLRIDLAFAGSLPSAEIYLGLRTPTGFFWFDPARGFTPTVARLYAGAVSTFGPSNFITIPDVAALASGGYVWVVLVDEQIDRVPAGDMSDFVFTDVQ